MKNLTEYLDLICFENGGRTAVNDAFGSYTFDGIRVNSLRVAAYIRSQGWSGKTVAIYMPKKADAVCAMMGVLYSGNIYVPLDVNSPKRRTELMLGVTSPELIITDAHGSFAGYKSVAFGELVAVQTETEFPFEPDSPVNTDEETPAYILFTSGSTGVPKGVVVPHRRVINYIEWARVNFDVGSADIIGSQAPFFFTVSVMDIYLCMATGATLELIPENLFSKPGSLLEYLNKKKVSLIFWVASVYRHIARNCALEKTRLKYLKRAWFVGEPMPADVLLYWMINLPQVNFVNMYGSTETDMTVCWYANEAELRKSETKKVPLGTPCANAEVFLLTENGGQANPGEIGEICISGPCLALGYYGKEADGNFACVPFGEQSKRMYRTGDLGEIGPNGLIYFHGRKDHQFKHLGYRVEAGEIEAQAEEFPGVKSACVLYNEEKRQISLFYEANGEVGRLLLTRSLKEKLPAYMMPTRYIELDKMPYNANGKKDRVKLKEGDG